ncbi:MAG: hypothetical protein ACKV22_21430 [Bryobacteraceae bacterium]
MRTIRLAVLLLVAAAAGAEIIDRIAITVGSNVITESELRQAVRLRQFLNGEPIDFRAFILRDAGERLVDQLLIRKENENSRYGAPPAESVQEARKQVIDQLFKGDPKAFAEALAAYGLTEEVLSAHLTWQLTVVRFVSVRFGTGIQTRPEEAQAYFEKEIAPKLPAGASRNPDDYRGRIEETLNQQRANEHADEWLRETRRRTVIDFHPEVFQ